MGGRREKKWENGQWSIECRGESKHTKLVPENEFSTYINPKGEKVFSSLCKKCKALKMARERQQDFIKYKVGNAITAAKKRKGLARIVDPDLYGQVLELFEKSNGLCAITKEPMLLNVGDERSLSIDRINNNLGYIKGNIQLVQETVNMVKGWLEGVTARTRAGVNIDWPLILTQVFSIKFIKVDEKNPISSNLSLFVLNNHGIDIVKQFIFLSSPEKKFKIIQSMGRIC
ncbi:hypothetical protein FAY30_26405 (plasmid) [Bacillus sp. S3]|uniref:hypothetical protein n=1 Tax=Bacillus sp. S3 TaxID=486398 RepID=UPI00118A1AFC|nr:hypothetical protein [Bacillus sp. S3]QCJ45474.1 hypothetical protein FAY30_26405 [Bacillus sp. S3]